MSAQQLDSLRLPKQLEADPRGAAILAKLQQAQRPLWSGSDRSTAVAALTPALTAVLRTARLSRHLTRGLEDAERALESEAKGLRVADRKIARAGGPDRGVRVSRLLLLSNDGAERFYRRVESLLRQHGARVLAVRLDADSEALGAAVWGPDTLVRLLLLTHKQTVSNSLLALSPIAAGRPRA